MGSPSPSSCSAIKNVTLYANSLSPILPSFSHKTFRVCVTQKKHFSWCGKRHLDGTSDPLASRLFSESDDFFSFSNSRKDKTAPKENENCLIRDFNTKSQMKGNANFNRNWFLAPTLSRQVKFWLKTHRMMHCVRCWKKNTSGDPVSGMVSTSSIKKTQLSKTVIVDWEVTLALC